VPRDSLHDAIAKLAGADGVARELTAHRRGNHLLRQSSLLRDFAVLARGRSVPARQLYEETPGPIFRKAQLRRSPSPHRAWPVAPGVLITDDGTANLAPVYREGRHGRMLVQYVFVPLPKTVCIYSLADDRPRLYAAVDLMAEFLVNGGVTPSVMGVVGDLPIVDV
jgi:hypothetical protein